MKLTSNPMTQAEVAMVAAEQLHRMGYEMAPLGTQARLAEAERLLIAVFDYGLRPERLKRIEAFLDGTADSAEPVLQGGCVVVGDGYCTTHKQAAVMCIPAMRALNWKEVAPK
jgi:hypothetical protein